MLLRSPAHLINLTHWHGKPVGMPVPVRFNTLFVAGVGFNRRWLFAVLPRHHPRQHAECLLRSFGTRQAHPGQGEQLQRFPPRNPPRRYAWEVQFRRHDDTIKGVDSVPASAILDVQI